MTQMHEEDRTQVFVPLVEGTLVSHFRLVRRIGAGGMGEVYLADDEQLGRRVALKFLPSQMSNDVDLKNRFIREARAAAKLSHPNIITIHEVGEFNGRPYFAMEYVEGKSLYEIAHGGLHKMSHLLALATQIAEGLRRAHEQGIIHRDVKSANIIVDADNRARILDFGLAAVLGSEKITRDGSTVGTVAYMSPEQIRGQAVDQRSDLFSFGIVLYELIAGRTPFKRDSDAATMHAISTETADPLARFKANVSPALQQVVDKALQKDMSMRYQTAADLASDLKRIQSEISTPSISSMPAGKPVLAVLPFDNLGAVDREYFADGITDEVIARLARLKELSVIAHASASQYKKSSKRPREIGQELGCGHLLQGTIRWDDSVQPSRVRINVKLTRVSDETYLWAETYDRVLEQIFVIQSEIAEKVADALGLTLLSSKQTAAVTGGTTNMEAYDYFLRAYECFPGTSLDVGRIPLARELYAKALEIDPNFAQAKAMLARAEIATYWFGLREPPRLVRAKQLIDEAIALSPGLYEAQMALGFYYYWGKMQYDPALEHFNGALTARPNDAEAFFGIAMIERRQGKFEESARRLAVALHLSPRNATAWGMQASTLEILRRYDEALQHIDRAIALKPDSILWYALKAGTAMLKTGSAKGANGVYVEAAAHGRPSELLNDPEGIPHFLAFHDGDAARALEAYEYVARSHPFPQLFLLIKAELARLAGKSDIQRAYCDALICTGEARLTENPGHFGLMGTLGRAYAMIGDREKALKFFEEIEKSKTVTDDAVDGPLFLVRLATGYVSMGDSDKALTLLRRAFSAPTSADPQLLTLLPAFEPLRDHPGFQELLQAVRQ